MKKLSIFLICLLAALTVQSCGYSYKAVLPDTIRKIYIPVFTNRTLQYNIEGIFTDVLIREFVSEGKLIEGNYLTIVPTKEEADAVLEGEIIQYILEPAVVDERGNVQENRMRLLVNISFKEIKENKTLWVEQSMECRKKIFWRVAPATGTPQTEQEAQTDLFQNLAKDIVSRTIWGW